MANPIIHPEGKFTVTMVGPSREFEIDGDNGKVTLVSYQVQFAETGVDWINVVTTKDKPGPTQGEVLEGSIEDTGKYGLKFKKASSGRGGGGRGGFSKGAAWANAVQTAATVLGEYAKINPKFNEGINNISDYLERLEQVAPEVKQMVDRLAGTDTGSSSEDDTNSESGESPAPAQPTQAAQPPVQGDGDIQVGGVNTAQLNKW